jgi:hypothetical protein
MMVALKLFATSETDVGVCKVMGGSWGRDNVDETASYWLSFLLRNSFFFGEIGFDTRPGVSACPMALVDSSKARSLYECHCTLSPLEFENR